MAFLQKRTKIKWHEANLGRKVKYARNAKFAIRCFTISAFDWKTLNFRFSVQSYIDRGLDKYLVDLDNGEIIAKKRRNLGRRPRCCQWRVYVSSSYRTVERNRWWSNNSTGIYACEYDELVCYNSFILRFKFSSLDSSISSSMSLFSILSLQIQHPSAASVNTCEIFCCFSTGLRSFGGFIGSFCWTKQKLVGIDPGFKLARGEPGFFVKHLSLK